MQDDSPRPVFIGRDRQLTALVEDAHRVRADGARAVLVCGDAGIGKTRLIDEYRDRTPLGRTAVGGCLELGGDGIPFAPFTALLRDLSRDPRDGGTVPVPGAGPVQGADDTGRARLFESVLTRLEERARPGGLLAVVEDLHWADASTRDLLVFLLRNLGEAPVHLVATVRTDDLHRTHPLRRLLPQIERLPRVSRLDVEPFSRDEVAAQAAALGGRPPVDLDLLHERSGGNPLFVEALLDGPDGPLPDGPRELLSAAVDRLPDDARRAVGLIAASGDRIDHTLLSAVARRAGIGEEALDTALRSAVDARVLRATADGYVFRHALLAEAVYTDLLPGERIRVHRRYAEALQRGVPGLTEAETALQLAHHAYAGGDQPLALSTAWAAAGHAAEAAAHPERLALLERVLELWDLVPDAAERVGEPRAEVLRLAATVCLLAGSLRRAVDYATEGLEELGVTGYHDPGIRQPPPNGALIAGLRYARAYAYKELGSDGGLEDLADAFVVMDRGDPHGAAASALLASTFMVRGHPTRARHSAEKALRTARETGDRGSEADALVTLGSLTAQEDPDEALRLIDEGIAAARGTGYVQAELRGWINLSGVLSAAGRIAESYDTARRGLARTEELGLVRTQGPAFRLSMGLGRFYQLRVEEGERLLDPAAGDRLVRARTWTMIQQLAFYRQDTAGVERAMEEFRRLLPEQSSAPSEYTPVRFTEMMRAAVEGRFDVAADIARGFLDGGDPENPHLDNLYMGNLAYVVEVVDMMRDEPGWREQTADLTAELRAAVAALPEDMRHPVDRLVRDQAGAQASGDAAEASRTLEGLLPQLREHRFHRMYLLLAAARAAARAGSADLAADRLAEVEAAARESGLTLFAELADRVRRAHGLPRPRSLATGETPAGLTKREAEVLRLVARGMTNREIGEKLFISAKTASVHMSNLMGKLGVTNRNAAAVKARELGLA
ncbi:helix-turn-helix transcriptional regulator [Nocardiopsis sp. CC223A]|uniref:helix-turn-helix transcriptional regulator n=1 Tax=Nocardiopsis sp. CC223A TaxID=3044051 RepID=UPI00278C889A|nr:helix-turn-helix transcriptional regulator [Nocardiopsis sp. CC223A]